MTTPTPATESASGSRLLGTTGLQDAIQALTQAVSSNTAAVQKMGSSAPGGTATPVGSTGQSITYGSFPKMATAFSAFQGSGAGSAANYATTPSGGNGNGQGGWGQAMNNPQGTLAGAAGAAGSMALSAFGNSSQFSTQVLMNQYASMGVNAMGPGGNMGQQMSAMYNQAFGRYGQNLNAIAFNGADAAQGFSTLQQIAASPYVNSTALGRAGYSMAAGIGYANPSLGAAQSSAAAAQVLNPQTSLLMRMYGYSATPRALGGVGNPLQGGQLAQTLLSRWYGKGTVSQGTLNAGLALGGKDQVSLQALGLDPNTYGPMLQMYNKLFQQGVSATQANTMLNAASHNQNINGQSAQKILSNKYGISTSDLQKMKDSTAQTTSSTSGEMSGFDSAVSGATTAVQKFESVLNHMLGHNGGILGKIAGYGSGLTGSLGAVGSGLGGAFSAGMGMLSGIFGGGVGSGGAGGGTSAGGGGTPGSTMTSMSKQVSTAIRDAESQLGKPYVWGGDNPATGFDCSGLVEWAYAQAGIKLPRTSQAQWAALQNRSVPLGKVRAGDIIFTAGSDGSATSPGHEALMISDSQYIEAPYTGANIRIGNYNPAGWQHAARPSGGLSTGGGGGTSGANGNGVASATTGSGNAGLGLAVGTYGSSNEIQNVAAALLGGGMSGFSGTLSSGSVGNGQGSGSISTPNVSSPNNASASQAQAVGKQLAAAYGWGSGVQWNDLVQLWNDESGWRWNATNAKSGAYGIPQALPGSKMASAGGNWKTSASTQIKWGLGYIQGRYGSPAAALAHENMVHWYADGTGSAQPGYALLGERGPELVRLGGGQQVVDAGRTANILKGQSAKPGATPWSAGTAAQLVLAAVPQNNYGRTMGSGTCTVQLNMPPGAINIHTQGSATDVSNATRQIMQGVATALADNETIRQIMDGVTG